MAKYVIDNQPAPIDFQSSDIIQRTLQNAKNLLMCRMWEVPFDRFRGFDPALFDLPINEFKAELLPELDRIMIYEPDANVLDADCKLLEDGTIYIAVTIDVTVKEAGTGE